MGKYSGKIKINRVKEPEFEVFEMDEPKMGAWLDTTFESGTGLSLSEDGMSLVLDNNTLQTIFTLVQKEGKFDGKHFRDDQLRRLPMDFFTEVIGEAMGMDTVVPESESPLDTPEENRKTSRKGK
jgi:hypothetical protein